MQKTRRFSLLVLAAALVLCLSAITVSVASADGVTPTLNETWEKTDINMEILQYGKGGVFTAAFENMAAGIYMVETVSTTNSDGYVRLGAIPSFADQVSYFRKTKTSDTANYVNTLWIRLPEGNCTVDFYGNGQTLKAMRLTKIEDLDKNETFFFDSSADTFAAWKTANGVESASYGAPGLIAVKQADDSYLFYPATDSKIGAYNAAGKAYTQAELDADPKWQSCYIRYHKNTNMDMTGFQQTPDPAKGYSGGRMSSIFVRGGDILRFVVTAPKAGKYTVYAPFGTNNTASSITLRNRDNGYESDPVGVMMENWNDSWTNAEQYLALGVLELKAGENHLEMQLTGTWANIGELAFTHIHEYTAYEKNETRHWQKCSCGAESVKENHGTPVEDNDCTTAATCPTCAYVVTPAAANHTGGTATCAEKAKCTVCNKAYGETLPHTGGTATCTDFAKCTVCEQEYGDLAPHTFTVAEKDATDHWKKCANCDAIEEKIAHTGGTATCTQKKTCTECGGEYGDLLAHEFTAYKTLEDGHVKKCANCDATDDTTKAAHEYGEDKKCVCGAEKTGCGASIAASAIAVTAVLGLGIGFIRKKKED